VRRRRGRQQLEQQDSRSYLHRMCADATSRTMSGATRWAALEPIAAAVLFAAESSCGAHEMYRARRRLLDYAVGGT